MKCNVGNADKTIRIAVGLILIVLSLLGTIGWWGYLGIIPLWAIVLFIPYWASQPGSDESVHDKTQPAAGFFVWFENHVLKRHLSPNQM